MTLSRSEILSDDFGRRCMLKYAFEDEEYPYRSKVRVKYLPKSQERKIFRPDTVLAAKYDGALSHLYIRNKGPSIAQSHRISKRTGAPIDHTGKIPGFTETTLPPDLGESMDLKGEVIYIDKRGRSIPHQDISGILNSTPANAVKKIEEKGLEPKVVLFNIWDDDRQYADKLKTLTQIAKNNPSLFLTPDVAHTDEDKKNLMEKIRSGKHPMTDEGVVLDGEHKIKFRRLAPVYIHSFYGTVTPGSRLQGSGVGGINYSLVPNGPIVGRVGTGFTEDQRKDFYRNSDKYLGRRITIEHGGSYPDSKAYRAPSFKGLA